jgi:hypothetical protein
MFFSFEDNTRRNFNVRNSIFEGGITHSSLANSCFMKDSLQSSGSSLDGEYFTDFKYTNYFNLGELTNEILSRRSSGNLRKQLGDVANDASQTSNSKSPR